MKKTLIFSFFALLLSVFLFGCKKVNPTVSIELQANKNSISYSLTFNDIEESNDRKYKIELSKDSTKVVEKVNSVLTKTGEFANLDFNTEYTFTVYISANKFSEEYTTKLGEKKISTELQTFEGVTFESKEFIYDGQAKSIEVSGQPEGTKVEYTNNACTEVGTHEVTAKLSKAGYNDLVLTAKITIVKGKYDFTLENKTKTYDGKPLEVTADTNLELTYEYYSGETKLTTAPTNAGTYTVKAIYAGDANHEGFTKTATLVINKENSTIVSQDVTKTYDGEAAIVSATVSNGGTAVITYNTEDGKAPVNAGTYTATVSYAGNNNYNAAANVTVNIVINKAASTLELEDKEVTYNGQAQTIEADTELSVTYEYYNGESKLSAAPVNAGTYKVKAIYAGDVNHVETSAEATLVIKKADVIITAADVNKTYDGEAAQVTATVSNGTTPVVEYSTTDKQAPVNAGTYTATITYAGDNNYNSATKTVNVVITKATVELEVEDKEVTFDGAAHTIEADTELDVTYEYYQGTTKLDAAPVNAGTYTVKAIYTGNENVAGKTVEATLVIKKADVNITTADINRPYDGEAAVVTATVSNNDNTSLTIEYYQGTLKLDAAPTEQGSYKAVITYAGNENYNSKVVEVSIIISNPNYSNITIEVEDITITYGEELELLVTIEGSTEVTVEDLDFEYYLDSTKLESAPVNAGTYTVKAIYAGDDELFINAAVSEVATIIINKANTTISATGTTVTYNGEEVTATATVSNGATPVVEYSTTDKQAPVNAGTYTATITYAGDNNYNAAEDVTVTIVIEKANTTITTEDITKMYNGKATSVVATVSNGAEATITYNTEDGLAPKNAGTYTATVSYAGDENYNAATTITVTIIIEKSDKVLTDSDVIRKTLTVDYTGADMTMADIADDLAAISVTYDETTPLVVGKNEIIVTLTLPNYENTYSYTLKITCNKVLIDTEVVLTGSQLRGKNFDKGVISIQKTYNDGTKENIKSFTLLNESGEEVEETDIDTSEEIISLKVSYNEETYSISVPTIKQPSLMIYAIYGGGGNKNATYTYDFVILYNNSANNTSLNGYSLQYFTKAGNNNGALELTGIIEGYGFYVIKCSTNNASVGAALPFNVNQECNFNLAGADFQVSLVASTTQFPLLEGNKVLVSLEDGNVIDYVGAGAGKYFETEIATAPSNYEEYIKRVNYIDGNNNKHDFAIVKFEDETFEYLTKGYRYKEELLNEINTLNINFNGLSEVFTLPTTVLGKNIVWSSENGYLTISGGSITPVVQTGVVLNDTLVATIAGVEVELVIPCVVSSITLLDKPELTVNHFTVTWNEIMNAISYEVYVNEVLVETTTERTYTLTDYTIDASIKVVAKAEVGSAYADSLASEIAVIEFAEFNDIEKGNTYTFKVVVTYKQASYYATGAYAEDLAGNTYSLNIANKDVYDLLTSGETCYVSGLYNEDSYGLKTITVTGVTRTSAETVDVETLRENLTKETGTFAQLYSVLNVVVEGVSGTVLNVKNGEYTLSLYATKYNIKEAEATLLNSLTNGMIIKSVKGVYSHHNGAPQLIVTDYEIENSELLKADALAIAPERTAKASLTLATTGKFGSTISWAVSEGTATIENGVATFTQTDAEQTVVLTATLTLNGQTRDVDVTVTVEKIGSGNENVSKTYTADLNTMGNANGSYTTRTSASGWVAVNAALMKGGTTNSSPTFSCVGTADDRGVALTGNINNVGTLTSPILNGGITKITFNYANVFSESKGVDIQVSIKDINGVELATKKEDNNSVTQHQVYEFVWELEEVIQGDFIVEIKNNSPSNSTSNKDRVVIFNITWICFN